MKRNVMQSRGGKSANGNGGKRELRLWGKQKSSTGR